MPNSNCRMRNGRTHLPTYRSRKYSMGSTTPTGAPGIRTCGEIEEGRRLREVARVEKVAGLAAPSDEKSGALRCILGIRWAKRMTKAAPACRLPGLVRRGLSDAAATRPAQQLQSGLFEKWNAVGRQMDADSASWRPFIESQGLTREASGQGRGETVT